MSKKIKAGLTLGALSVGLVAANVLVTPNIAWWLGQDMGTWLGLGQTIGGALASALNMPLLEIVGILLFVA